MKKIFTLLSISLLVLACGSSKQNSTTNTTTTAPKPAVDAKTYATTITSAELKEALYIYASDEFEGRETGQVGQKKAAKYLKNYYVESGIPSAKADGDYFQNVPLEISAPPKVNFNLNHKNFNAIDDFVSIVSTKDGGINAEEIVYAGFGIEDEAYSSYNGMSIKGKVILIKSGEPKNEDGTFVISGTEESSKWSKMREQFKAKRNVAINKGAKAVLFYYPETYTMIASRFGSPKGRMSLKDSDVESMYFFLINTSVAETILESIETTDENQTIKMPIQFDYLNASDAFNSENVAAYIKGSEKPDEIIVISAHLDHEGIKNGEIYNGADDDGSGSVALLEMAEAFKMAANDGHGPKRSVLFLHVTGEEKGLLGSQYYTDYDPIFPLKNTVANLNIDMIGRTDPKHDELNERNYLYLIGSDKLSTELHTISEEVNKKYTKINFDYTYNDDNDPNQFYYRSDHYNFAKNNIPVIFYFSGTHVDYHQPGDTADKIEYDLLETRTRLVFYTAWELANRNDRIIVDKITD